MPYQCTAALACSARPGDVLRLPISGDSLAQGGGDQGWVKKKYFRILSPVISVVVFFFCLFKVGIFHSVLAPANGDSILAPPPLFFSI